LAPEELELDFRPGVLITVSWYSKYPALHWFSFVDADLNPSDPLATYEYLVSKIKTLHPDFAYLHVVEPRIKGDGDEAAEEAHHAASNHTLRELWGSKPYISAGGYNRETALIAAERGNELIAFGRQFLANVGRRSIHVI
jgi:2,4-dienoyl-CoA reductase-like NADH-dependent reductase (Old Yellow Enzyme family)